MSRPIAVIGIRAMIGSIEPDADLTGGLARPRYGFPRFTYPAAPSQAAEWRAVLTAW
ncbi:hypothetical protein BQ8482_180380 [Mesorhizobium delmotii]|uniref:Uncharacterized protein n=1 Tax=Mesorhizobium delmotii TaxID=1631247 RepID=A0A2P9AJ37_9HYPH|nr:hypothetical protein BQ8482_180380 [Mesorhizobium delmotii]